MVKLLMEIRIFLRVTWTSQRKSSSCPIQLLSSNSLRSCLNGSDMSLHHHSAHLLMDPFKPPKGLFHPTSCLTDLTMMDEVELKSIIIYKGLCHCSLVDFVNNNNYGVLIRYGLINFLWMTSKCSPPLFSERYKKNELWKNPNHC